MGVVSFFKEFTFTQSEQNKYYPLKHSLFHEGTMTTNDTLIPTHPFCNCYYVLFQHYFVPCISRKDLRTCKYWFFLFVFSFGNNFKMERIH